VADVVQETFLAAARSAGGYDASRGSLWVWLGGIARNHVAIHYRRQARQDRIRRAAERLGENGFLAGRWLDPAQYAPPESLDRAELAVLVRAALGGLPDEYSALLTGKYLDGSPLDELAAQRRVSLEAVRSKLARARRAFRKAFAKLGAQPALPKNQQVPE
jgi:RNA polymerase sigma-70 factor (ECF subfamily)